MINTGQSSANEQSDHLDMSEFSILDGKIKKGEAIEEE